MSPSPWAWNLDPIGILVLVALLGGYLLVMGPMRGRLGLREPRSSRRMLSFLTGWLVLALTMLSPLDTLGRSYLLLARTGQMFLMITLVAPLLMLGVDDELMARLIPLEALRQALSRQRFTVFAVVIFNAIILTWQIPSLVKAAGTNSTVHGLQFFFWLLAGVLDWWPLLTPLHHERRLARVAQILYLTAESIPLDAFGLFLLFAHDPIYRIYANAPRVTGLSPLLDQQLSGALVAVPGNILDFFLMSLVFFGWIRRVEQAQNEREEAEHLEELRAMQGE